MKVYVSKNYHLFQIPHFLPYLLKFPKKIRSCQLGVFVQIRGAWNISMSGCFKHYSYSCVFVYLGKAPNSFYTNKQILIPDFRIFNLTSVSDHNLIIMFNCDHTFQITYNLLEEVSSFGKAEVDHYYCGEDVSISASLCLGESLSQGLHTNT